MAIYLLMRKDNCGYDEYHEKVIRAESEAEAQRIANTRVGDEGEIWDKPEIVDVELIDPFGAPCEIMGYFHHG